MRKLIKRVLVVATTAVAVLAAVPVLVWLSLTHQPGFYRAMVAVPHEQREANAKRFVSQSLQLRNDIANEPAWEAVFTDEAVNAWLAEDLVKYFADQLPPEVHEPRVKFELDRVTLAFELDQGPVRSVIWVVASPRVPEENVLELTLEKIRAGMVPVPADKVLDRLVAVGPAARSRRDLEARRAIPRGHLPVHHSRRPRRHQARTRAKPQRRDSPGRPVGSQSRPGRRADTPHAAGSSVEVPEAEHPARRAPVETARRTAGPTS